MIPPGSAGGGHAFEEAWEAQAFAMAVALHERGLFSWSEWTARVAAEALPATGEESAGPHYISWLTALERLVADNGIAHPETLARYRQAWRRAAARTPHGMPIELQRSDFA
jgi:nitrile hydratase accessory protein